MHQFHDDGPASAPHRLVLAHGAGAGMYTPFLNYFAEGLGERGVRVVRFEFPYMARFRKTKKREPPDPQAVLEKAWLDAIASLATEGGFVLRQMYTDDGETRFRGSRPVILNGIEDFVVRGDLADRSDDGPLASAVHENGAARNRLVGNSAMNWKDVLAGLRAVWTRLQPLVCDTSLYLSRAMSAGRRVLFEGAQGTLLDIDHGTYPFVTSSNATAGGAATGLGLGPKTIGTVLGVAKAYTTRVGAGPLPTELTGEIGERLRETGQEYGASTGRPRRCGWYDAVAVRYAVRVNGLDALAITKLDVLDGLETLDDRLESAVPPRDRLEKLIQGPIADALWHVGQLAMLRGMAGAPVRPESYARAHIAIGRVGRDQPPPVAEFDGDASVRA